MKGTLIIIVLVGYLGLETGKGQTAAKFENFLWSKRYKVCLAERDDLCGQNKMLRSDTARMRHQIDSLLTAYNDLSRRFEHLSEASGTRLAALSASLVLKSKELQKKEKSLLEKDVKLRELQSLLSRQDSILMTLNTTVRTALLGFASDEFTVEMREGKVYVSLSNKLLFKSGSADIEEKGKEAIKKLAEVLNNNTAINISIEGHTDSIPIRTTIYRDNWDLSVARSTSIVRILCNDYAVSAKRVTAAGRGEFFPVASNATAEGRARNRRTDIILSPELGELFRLLNTPLKH